MRTGRETRFDVINVFPIKKHCLRDSSSNFSGKIYHHPLLAIGKMITDMILIMLYRSTRFSYMRGLKLNLPGDC